MPQQNNIYLIGVPDLWRECGTANFFHGREIAAGDADKVLYWTPSIPYRAPSPASGEFHFKQSIDGPRVLESGGRAGLVIHGHNLTGVGAKVRAVLCETAATCDAVAPTGNVIAGGTSNASKGTGGDVTNSAEVDENVYDMTDTTYVTPTVSSNSWSIEVPFDNSDALETGTDKQVVLFHIRAVNGDNGLMPSCIFRVKEGAAVRATMSTDMMSEVVGLNGARFVFLLPCTASSFTVTTMTNASAQFFSEAGTSNRRWELWAITWYRLKTLGANDYDTGWVSVVDAPTQWGGNQYWLLRASVGETLVIPYLAGSGDLRTVTNANNTRVFFRWGNATETRSMLDPPPGFPVWTPQIGMMMEGPGFKSNSLANGYRFWLEDRTVVTQLVGGGEFMQIRQPVRMFQGTLNDLSATDFIDAWDYLRRVGSTVPIALMVLPEHATIGQHTSMVGKLINIQASHVDVDRHSISMTFREWL